LLLLRFKPAPIYILDEVDAALDLNHTQNIGSMIKQHFPQVRLIHKAAVQPEHGDCTAV
jgi:structural maintenance of chromosome 2